LIHQTRQQEEIRETHSMPNTNTDALIALLRSNQQAMSELNTLLEAQAALIISNAVDELKANTQAVRVLSKTLSKLELQRKTLWQEAQWPENWGLNELSQVLSTHQGDLRSVQADLKTLATQTEFYKARNQRLLEASVAWVKETIGTFSKAQNQQEAFASAYSPQGRPVS
jgi:Mg2+ and Co2+ transporter CorA